MPSLNSDNSYDLYIKTHGDPAGVDTINKSVAGMSQGFQDTMKKVSIATGIAAAGLTAFAKSSTDQLINTVKASKDLARQTGMTVEQSSALTAAMKRVGIESAQSNVAFRTFAKQIVATTDDTRTSATALDQLGIKVKDASGKTRDFESILLETADKFKAMPNGVEKTTAAVELFGRSGTSMVKVLNKGSDGIKELEDNAKKLGLTLTGKNIADVEKYIESTKKLADTNQSLKLAVGALTAPVLTKFNTTLNDMLLKLIAVDSPFRGVTANVLAFGGPILGAVSGTAAFLANVDQAIPALVKFGQVLKLGAALEAMQAGLAAITYGLLPAMVGEIGVASAAWVAAFPVAGILADIALVYAAFQSVKGAYEAVNNAQIAQANAKVSDEAAHRRLLDLQKNGSDAQKAQATKALKAGFASGGFTGKGAADEVAGVVHKGEYVIPKSQVDQRTGTPKGGDNHFHGPFIFQTAAAVRGFFEMQDRDTLLTSKGFAARRGM